jgi:hypothetical protein
MDRFTPHGIILPGAPACLRYELRTITRDENSLYRAVSVPVFLSEDDYEVVKDKGIKDVCAHFRERKPMLEKFHADCCPAGATQKQQKAMYQRKMALVSTHATLLEVVGVASALHLNIEVFKAPCLCRLLNVEAGANSTLSLLYDPEDEHFDVFKPLPCLHTHD